MCIGAEGCANAVGMGVGEDDLAEGGGADDAKERFHALLVEFFEDVVKKEDGKVAELLAEVGVLGELEGKEVALLLTLGTKLLQVEIVEGEPEVVFMDAL